MRKMMYCDAVGNIGSFALLLVRLVVGVAFFYHGDAKIHHDVDSWMNGMMAAGQSPPPSWVQMVAAYTEYVCGPLLIVGFLTRFASLGLIGMMAGAMYFVHLPKHDPFVAVTDASFERALVYLVIAIMFFIVGPGRLSLDHIFFRTPKLPKL